MEENVNFKLKRLQHIVGRLTANVHPEVIKAIEDNEKGVFALAERLINTPGVRRPAAVFVTSIRNREHLDEDTWKDPAAIRPRMPRATLTASELMRYRVMQNEWTTIQSQMHVPWVKAMFTELKAGCMNPDDPTNEEAEKVRKTMIYALTHPDV